MTRDEAIARLRSMGRNASARDWAMGKTICITTGEPSTVGAISLYSGVVYLYPVENGTWNLLDCGLSDPAESYPDLESAIHGAHEYVGRKERDRGAERE